MDRPSSDDWFSSLLTAGAFSAMVMAFLSAFIDALGRSPWSAAETALGFVCGVTFISLLATDDSLCSAHGADRGTADDVAP